MVPEEISDKNISGRITVEFFVNSQGFVTELNIIHGLDPLLDNEVCRVIMSSPLWKGAKQNGKGVTQVFVMPVSIESGKVIVPIIMF